MREIGNDMSNDIRIIGRKGSTGGRILSYCGWCSDVRDGKLKQVTLEWSEWKKCPDWWCMNPQTILPPQEVIYFHLILTFFSPQETSETAFSRCHHYSSTKNQKMNTRDEENVFMQMLSNFSGLVSLFLLIKQHQTVTSRWLFDDDHSDERIFIFTSSSPSDQRAEIIRFRRVHELSSYYIRLRPFETTRRNRKIYFNFTVIVFLSWHLLHPECKYQLQ